jgi:histidinol dehydrogenase
MMKINEYPSPVKWDELIQRPPIISEEIEKTVQGVFQQIKLQGDQGIRYFTRLFDGVELTDFKVSITEFDEAIALVNHDTKKAIQIAYQNIHRFHANQISNFPVVETSPGISCWLEEKAIERVGLYIPGGTAPLFSSLLMLGIPAKIAGCEEVIICSPPNKNGKIHPTILYVASILGFQQVYKVGGIQAIAAMTFGSSSIKPVQKIFGPGNTFVTKAKEMAQQYGVAIDMPAGPSEVLIIADESCNPEYVAADLLSQAEHGTDSQVILVSNNREVLESCITQVSIQVEAIPRREIAKQALANSKAVLCHSLKECLEFSNQYAPEHLIIATHDPLQLAKSVKNAGSVFLGNYSCESAGDYASGTNHTLPTNGFAKNYSGVSVASFCKRISFQQISREGIQKLGPSIEVLAEAEGLWAHKNAVSIRLKDIRDV